MRPDLRCYVTTPVGIGDLANASATAEGDNPVCGDRLRFAARLADGRVTGLRFRATACPACMAVASVAVVVYEGQERPEGPPYASLRAEIERLGGLSRCEQHALALVEQVLSQVLR